MKKIISAILVLMLALAVLASCKNKTEYEIKKSGEGITVSFPEM